MTRKILPAFEVDRAGLGKLLARRGRSFAVVELVQNAWDEAPTRVDVTLEADDGAGDEAEGFVHLKVVDDDPEGFRDFSHAFTLFAESAKKADPEKRGRFNLGEKLVVAICREARLTTTSGTVRWLEGGRIVDRKTKTEHGSIFEGWLEMEREEMEETIKLVHSLIPPAGITTTLNGEMLEGPEPRLTFEATLATERADEEGRLLPTKRKTTVTLYDAKPATPRLRRGERVGGGAGMLYEMGLPVVPIGGAWNVNVGQKVPLTTDRDNVPPAYLRALRAEVLNHAAQLIPEEQSGEKWLDHGLSDRRITKEAVETVLDKRFGEKRVIFDPSDLEANKRAVASGYTVIAPRSLSKDAWAQVKRHEAALPAGQVTPSPRPYGDGEDPASMIPEEKWSAGMRTCADFSNRLAERLLDHAVRVVFVNDPKVRTHAASYTRASATLEFNLGVLGRDFFWPVSTELLELLLHEFAHDFEGDHLSDDYHHAVSHLGVKLTGLALADEAVQELLAVWEERA